MKLRTKPAAKGVLVQRAVIGIFGNKQHGKDTLGEFLALRFLGKKKRVKRFALADPLKRAAITLLGMPRRVAFGDGLTVPEREVERIDWTRYGRNGREWLQWIGTEMGREQIDQDLWVDRAVDTVVGDDQGTHFHIITDCRFHTERVNLARKLEDVFIPFVKVRIRRPGHEVDLSHPSESEVASMSDDLFDYVIINDGTLARLELRADKLVHKLMGGE